MKTVLCYGDSLTWGYSAETLDRHAFEERRCLIPLTAWAEAEGAKGQMTRTWLSLPDAPLFAAAGVWRPSDEWGDCYSMVMTDSEGSDAAAVHTRMPVLLAPGDFEAWLHATDEQAHAMLRGMSALALTGEPAPRPRAARRTVHPPAPDDTRSLF